jgi:hypothetical protein
MKLILFILACLSLTSCNLIIGLRQTNPNGYTPKVVEKWWNDQQQP